jgi:hypothetical protein
MDRPTVELELSPTALPHGTQIGAWRVYGIQGRGTYGTVYRAVREDGGQSGLAALKLAVYPGDPRFEREAALLSRIRHPNVPRLLDSGLWRDPSGRPHPYVVMEWVEGVPLYEWAARRNPSSRQVMTLLAQAAGALQATHAAGGVHRDVKGDNLLVRPADGRLFLIDFGVGHFAGVSRVTPLHLLPGTPHYRSPEMWDYVRPEDPNATSPTLARPSDDVFALGVTAYRLVTDTYPPFTNLYMEQGQCWRPGGGGPQPPGQLNPRVDATLNALILRMLSPRPEERGPAGELAAAMGQGAEQAGPSADEPLFEWETLKPSEWTEEQLAEAELLGHRPRRRSQKRVREAEQEDASARAELERTQAEAYARRDGPARQGKPRAWLPWLAAMMALGLWPAETGSLRAARSGFARKGDAVSLGDAAQSASEEEPEKDADQKAIALEIPRDPLPGQLRPDARGRCRKKQILINGGCWLKVDLNPDECPGSGYEHQGGCYVPIFVPGRQPASAPREREP